MYTGVVVALNYLTHLQKAIRSILLLSGYSKHTRILILSRDCTVLPARLGTTQVKLSPSVSAILRSFISLSVLNVTPLLVTVVMKVINC